MESLKRALEQIGRMWANLSATQRVVLSAAAAVMVVLLIFGSVSSTETWVRIAGPEVDASKRADILRKLQERNQKHEVRANEILVPKQDADRVVLDIAGEGALSDDAMEKLLATNNIFMSSRDKEALQKQALENKLASMIRGVEFVRNARVVITPGSKSDQMFFEGHRATASVKIELQEGSKLSTKNVVAIANLVAKSVPGLDADQVVITDNKLNSYAMPKEDGGTGGALWFREYEEKLEERIKNEIKQAFRTASVTVRVTAKATSGHKEVKKFTNPKAEQEEDRRIKKGGSGANGRSLKGEDSVTTTPDSLQESEQELRVKNRFDEENEKTNNPAGKIERITVGVLIPVEVGPDGKELAEAERQRPTIESWVKAAADAPVNSVSVSFIPTKKLEPVAAAALETSSAAATWIAANWMKVLLGAFAFVAFVVIVRVIQANSAKDTVEELQALTSALTETREAQVELGLPGEVGDVTRVKQGLQDMVERNPQGVAASLKSFMSGR
jgi:flagellar M-ring protein FliF